MPIASQVDYDAELRLHNSVFSNACRIGPHDHVLDVGCGAGQTTRDAARLAASATGIDISAAMLDQARRQTEAAGLCNVTFLEGDAQRHDFATQRFDALISRFGMMFFADPPAAFSHLAQALRSDGRLTMMVWQARQHNEWSVAIQQALATSANYPGPPPTAPNPFSLGDPALVAQLLETSGFADAAFTNVDVPVYYGADLAAALAWITNFGYVNDLLHHLEPTAAERVRAGLRHMITSHVREDGVWFDSRAWLVTARRR